MRNHFKDAKLSRMSSGTYCIIRDLGLVKGGKGMRHHEVLVTFSLGALGRSIGLVRGDLAGVSKRRLAWLQRVPERLAADVNASSVPESASQP
ncbi:hypothetical protein [Bradyrhizobium lablabi]|uniref:hypothetical protein n=1 Tax=Bradyrhizobium lablabi TaxID=722472 RepID=UPI00115FD7ED|nr:hypothetical protein [Bradyrhizobium lablabi]